jgi:hypothetical protein
MSPRAACRLEALGFTERYDYVTGKADWLARALPTEGAGPHPPRVADLLRDDVATADLDERIAHVRPRADATPYGFALVTGRGGVLLGRLRRAALQGDPAATAEEVMESGPSTIRPRHGAGRACPAPARARVHHCRGDRSRRDSPGNRQARRPRRPRIMTVVRSVPATP